jgi:chitinase
MRILRFSTLIVILFLLANGCKKSPTPAPGPTPGGNVPACTTNQSPANASFVIAGSSITLSWNATANASAYDVYLGTSNTPTTVIASGVANTSLSFPVPAAVNTTYYWYVQPKNSNGSATGCSSSVSYFSAIEIKSPAPFGFYIVGYFPSYRAIADVPDIKFRMTNVVNYAFFSVNSSGVLTVPSSTHASQLIAKARANGARVMVSINDEAAGNFKNMAATPTGRLNFIKDLMNKIRQFGFDGADIDWEYPSTSDGSDVTYTALMKELSDSLHRDGKYYLTAAITPGKYAGGARDAIRAEIFPYVDYFNLMAYDDFNTTVAYRHHSDYSLATTALNYWISTRGMPRSKAVLGIPAYGRPSGITQSGTVLTYRDILSRGGSPQSDSAFVTTTAFPNGFTIYYNGQRTVKLKTMLAKQQANGVMMWEKWQDAMDNNSLLKAVNDTLARNY